MKPKEKKMKLKTKEGKRSHFFLIIFNDIRRLISKKRKINEEYRKEHFLFLCPQD